MKKLILSLSVASMIFTVQSCDKKMDNNAVNDEVQLKDSTLISEDNNNVDAVTELVVPLSSKSGSSVTGNVTFTQNGDEVTMKVDVSGLKEGEHAIHVHENGDCSSDDGKSAGGHWNPTGKNHGKWGEGEFHQGDIGNLVADADGNATLTFSTDMWKLDDNATNGLVGKAIIIHEGKDDFKTQPTGDAGGRVACGVIK